MIKDDVAFSCPYFDVKEVNNNNNLNILTYKVHWALFALPVFNNLIMKNIHKNCNNIKKRIN